MEDTLDFGRIYRFRFDGIPQDKRDAAWAEIAPFIHRKMGSPETVLDPAAGNLEFLKSVPAGTRWAVDLQKPPHVGKGIHFQQGDIFLTELPAGFFDGVFLSNFLEHLNSAEDAQRLLNKTAEALRPGGKIAILGPNYKYCFREYFDCVDHKLVLTDVSVSEILYASGFRITEAIPRFLPYSFRGRLPPSPFLVRTYLKMPFAWKLFGKQFLVIGEKE